MCRRHFNSLIRLFPPHSQGERNSGLEAVAVGAKIFELGAALPQRPTSRHGVFEIIPLDSTLEGQGIQQISSVGALDPAREPEL